MRAPLPRDDGELAIYFPKGALATTVHRRHELKKLGAHNFWLDFSTNQKKPITL